MQNFDNKSELRIM